MKINMSERKKEKYVHVMIILLINVYLMCHDLTFVRRILSYKK